MTKSNLDSPLDIPFNKPFFTGNELSNISKAHSLGRLSGDGPFTFMCQDLLEKYTNAKKVLLTHSCTAALDLSALLLEIQIGDEIIMPSYTFVSTANAFVLRGATPVFVDIRSDTGNIDENLIENAITHRTKAIVVVHYAGVSCEMDKILTISKKYKLPVIEDAAQGVMSYYKGKALGSIGHIGTLSFHETKNVTCGEGGALLVNHKEWVKPAEIIREKGTDRSRFLKGEIDKYTWQSAGSSFLPGELVASFLYAQLQEAKFITNKRMQIWKSYKHALEHFECKGILRCPIIPANCQHNAHMFYLIVENESVRSSLLQNFRKESIGAIFHYIPLHNSPAGLKYGRCSSDLSQTNLFASCIIRLPIWIGMTDVEISKVINVIEKFYF